MHLVRGVVTRDLVPRLAWGVGHRRIAEGAKLGVLSSGNLV